MFHNAMCTTPRDQGPCFTLPEMHSIVLPSTVGLEVRMHMVCPVLNVTDGTGGWMVEGSMLLLYQSVSLHDACDEDPKGLSESSNATSPPHPSSYSVCARFRSEARKYDDFISVARFVVEADGLSSSPGTRGSASRSANGRQIRRPRGRGRGRGRGAQPRCCVTVNLSCVYIVCSPARSRHHRLGPLVYARRNLRCRPKAASVWLRLDYMCHMCCMRIHRSARVFAAITLPREWVCRRLM
ncbi:hypothetical protein F4678DRAFT_86386 [Xylaria arbuscula]|nr:hypothetical protein F4678DRAFT_86386 [Xylaria arbuscula]